jgi:Na+/melibiose symporter-like transporter
VTGHRTSRGRLLLFAFGDFAFNLSWQSVMLFLLFYHTDALGIPVAVAAAGFTVASVWDGIVSLLVGLFVDRHAGRIAFGRLLLWTALPLGGSFVLAYAPPIVPSAVGVALVIAAHLLFRTAYACANVPYLAMTARISAAPADRRLVAGARMLFGTAASIVVALGTAPIGSALIGSGSRAYVGAAITFALAGCVILAVVGASYREPPGVHVPAGQTLRAAVGSLVANRAYRTLNAAMMAMIVATTVFNKSILYYFKYVVGDPSGGELALAAMGAISAVAVPAWMLLARSHSLRRLWLGATAVVAVGLASFAALDLVGAGSVQLFLVAMQAMIVGLHFVFWAMLPGTIDYGEQTTGLRIEAAAFGLAALLQRIAIGVGTLLLGWSFGEAGYVANAAQDASALATMRSTLALLPLAFFLLSGALMLLNPLRRDVPLAPA